MKEIFKPSRILKWYDKENIDYDYLEVMFD